jgi:very-short-patch-repair endonuclease
MERGEMKHHNANTNFSIPLHEWRGTEGVATTKMETITKRARELRKNQTEAEAILWERVRDRKLGFKIVRQKPILLMYFEKKRAFVADFYCSEKKLAIELDGSVHEKQAGYDELRTLLLKQKGLRLIRYTNDDVCSDTDGVIENLKAELSSPHPPGPLSIANGEGEI